MPDRQNKPPQTARDRLARISHHFLSDEETSLEESSEKKDGQVPKKDVYTLALLNTVNDGEELPVFLLSQQLATRGRSSAILDCATGMNMVSFTSRNDSQQTRTVHHGLPHHNLEDVTQRLGDKPHDVYFLLVDTMQSSRLSLVNKVLLTTPTTPDGLQRTYTSIKQLTAHHNTAQIGVIITGTSDVPKAEEAYNKLATAVHRFMGRDLSSYGYLSEASDISEYMAEQHHAPMSPARPDIVAIAEIINDEISEWQTQNNDRYDQQKTQSINPAATNVKISQNIKSVTITSDDDLLGLIIDALPEIPGGPYRLVCDSLPFEGHHILALNEKKQPFVIVYDNNDGKNALLSGLSVLEGLSKNRAIIQRLYPNVFNSHNQSQLYIEDTCLIVLSPSPPPGGAYLSHTLNYLTFCTFHTLQFENKNGLLIEPCFTHIDNTVQRQDSTSNEIAHAFRAGKKVLSQEEATYFQYT